MFRKNLLFVSLMVILIVAFSACSKKQTTEPPMTEPEVTETTPPPPPPVEEEEPVMEEEVEPVKMPVLEDVFFDFDKFSLTMSAQRKLDKNATQLRDASSFKILIEGHCDERGTNAYNLALGEKRAKAAKDYLVSQGIAASRISTVSYGEERPFDTGHDETAWSKNRRGHFVVKQ